MAPNSSEFGLFDINVLPMGESLERFLRNMTQGTNRGSVSACQISPL